MEFFRRYLTQIKAQLTGLTVSQKLLIGLLLVVMAGAIFFTVTLSAKPDMVVLIPQAMTSEEINQVEMNLKGKHEYQVQGDKILVPAEKAFAIRGELFAAQALPKNITVAFAELIKANHLFDTESNTVRQWNYATQETLTRMLRYFPYIEDGTVIIAKGERAGLGRDGVASSASVTVKVRNGEGLSGGQVVAIVDMVRGAVPGLKREDVHVTDGQRVYHAPGGDVPMPSDLLAYKKAMEDEYTRKLWNMFGYVGNVKIAVNVVPDMSQTTQNKESYEKSPVKAVQSETNKETTSNDGAGGGGGEPGLKSNGSATAGEAATSGGRRTSSTMTDTISKYENKFPGMVERKILPPGTIIMDMTASISFPRSYFVQLYQRINKDPDPADDKLQPVIEAQMKRAVAVAKGAIGAKTDDQIKIDWFDDTVMPRGVEISGMGGTLASGNSMGVMVSQYAKQAVLGAVALGVLGMMLMMVRRAVPSTGGAEIDPRVFFGGGGSGGGGSRGKRKQGEPGMMDVGDDVFGEAGEGDAVLTGIELDDETLQSRKMVDEVSIMIKENPENAGALVKRWIQKGK